MLQFLQQIREVAMNNTKRTAIGGLTTAFVCMIMVLANLIPIGQYAIPAIAGMVIFMMSFVSGRRWGFYSFIASSIISFILCADKETVMVFVLFFGYYPLLKSAFEKIKVRIVSFLLKLLVFNAAAVAIYYICLYVFGITQNFELFGVDLPFVMLLLLNIVFVAYDKTLSLYEIRYSKRITKFAERLFGKK